MRFLLRVYFRWLRIKITLAFAALGIRAVVRALEKAPPEIVGSVLKQYGASIGERIVFKGPVRIANAYGDATATGDFRNLTIGNDCYVGGNVLLDLAGPLVMEDHSLIGHDVQIWTHTDVGYREMSAWYPRRTAGVTLKRGTWIPPRCMILCGVELGPYAVAGAGSVVTKSFGQYAVVTGVPARQVKTLDPALKSPAVN